MEFLKKFENDLQKKGIETGAAKPPRYWFSTGNYVLNRIISGDFYGGVPQGRVISLAGPSGSGKSFLACNIMREAQTADAVNVIVDTEHAIDNNFLSAIGVDPSHNVIYTEANTIPDCKKIVSTLIQDYKKEYGNDPDAPRVHVTIDSLDMLMTETEQGHFDKGVTKGDQGQRNKQLKAMLREFVQSIKHLNMSIVVVSQVYANQDMLNGEGRWIIGDAVKYAPSLVVLLTRLKLKVDSVVEGIRMKGYGYKTRFTKPYQSVTIEVPYDEGMNPYSGLLDVAKAMGVVNQKGARYTVVGEDKSWYGKELADHIDKILPACQEKTKAFLAVGDDEEEEFDSQAPSAKKKRQALYEENK